MPRRTHRRARGQKGKRMKRPRSFHHNADSPGVRQVTRFLFDHVDERKAA